MGKVWLVTSGSYSDYKVIIAFTTKELADAFVVQHKEGDKRAYGDPYEVEDYPLLNALPGPDRITYRASVTFIAGAVAKDWRGTLETPEWEAGDVSEQEGVDVSEYPSGKILIQARSPDRDRLELLVRDAVAEQLAKAAPVG